MSLDNFYSNPEFKKDKSQRRFKVLVPTLNSGVTHHKYQKKVYQCYNNIASDPRLVPSGVEFDKKFVLSCSMGVILHDLIQLYTDGYISKELPNSIWMRLSAEDPTVCGPIAIAL